MKNPRTAIALGVALALTASLAACGGDSPTAAPTSAATTATPTPTPTPAEPSTIANTKTIAVTPVDIGAMAKLGVMVDESQTRTDRYGKWNPLTISKANESPLFNLPTDKISKGAKSEWSTKELTDAYRVASQYLVNEYLDSEMLWDSSAKAHAAYMKSVSDVIGTDLSWWKEKTAAPKDSSQPWAPILVDADYSDWREEGGTGIEADLMPGHKPAPYKAGESRVNIERLQLQSVDVLKGEGFQAPSFTYSVAYRLPTLVDGLDKSIWESTSGIVTVNLWKDGTWKLIGSDINVSRTIEAQVDGGPEVLAPIPAPDTAPSDWTPHTVGAMTLSLPSDWTKAKDTSRVTIAKDAEALVLDVPLVQDATKYNQAVVTATTKESPISGWYISWGAHSYSITKDGTNGGVDILESKAYDDITLQIESPDNSTEYYLQVRVEPGTGDELARQIVSTMTFA